MRFVARRLRTAPKVGASSSSGGGGSGAGKPSKPQVSVTTNQRQRRKFVTVVAGLAAHNSSVKLSAVAKDMSKKFSCSCSATKGADEISIQGSFADEVIDMLMNTYQVKKKYIRVIDNSDKKKKAGK